MICQSSSTAWEGSNAQPLCDKGKERVPENPIVWALVRLADGTSYSPQACSLLSYISWNLHSSLALEKNIASNSWRTHVLLISTCNSRIDHLLSHKISLNYLKNVETTSCNFSDNKGKFRIYTNTWRLNNTFLSELWVIEKVKVFHEANKNGNTTYKNQNGYHPKDKK